MARARRASRAPRARGHGSLRAPPPLRSFMSPQSGRSDSPAARAFARFVADRGVDMIRDRLGWETVGYGTRSLRGLGTPPFHGTPRLTPSLAPYLRWFAAFVASLRSPPAESQAGCRQRASAETAMPPQNEPISTKRHSPATANDATLTTNLMVPGYQPCCGGGDELS